jgi:anti-sigma-K factor RskA
VSEIDEGSSLGGHEDFELMAAAYALDALEDAEALIFASHLASCVRCQTDVAAYRDVAAGLGESTSSARPRPELRQQILDRARGLAAEGPPRAGPDGGLHTGNADGHDLRTLVPLSAARDLDALGRRGPVRGHPWRQRALVGAAAAVIVVGGVLGGVLATGGGNSSPPSSCTAATACVQATLTSSVTHEAAATLIVSGSTVWIRPLRLAPDDPRRQLYVLWQIDGHQPPRAIGGFDVAGGRHRLLAVGSLVARRSPTTTFALSLEHGRRVPKRPSDVIAVTHRS